MTLFAPGVTSAFPQGGLVRSVPLGQLMTRTLHPGMLLRLLHQATRNGFLLLEGVAGVKEGTVPRMCLVVVPALMVAFPPQLDV